MQKKQYLAATLTGIAVIGASIALFITKRPEEFCQRWRDGARSSGPNITTAACLIYLLGPDVIGASCWHTSSWASRAVASSVLRSTLRLDNADNPCQMHWTNPVKAT